MVSGTRRGRASARSSVIAPLGPTSSSELAQRVPSSHTSSSRDRRTRDCLHGCGLHGRPRGTEHTAAHGPADPCLRPAASAPASPSLPASPTPRPTIDTPEPTPEPTPIPFGGAPIGETERATVVAVVDGDTIKIDRGHGIERVRYIGVDTPEIVHPSKPVEFMGKEASAANKALVEGREVLLERDLTELDRYGRLLRYVWVEDPSSPSGLTFVNAALLAGGFAQVVTYPPDVRYVTCTSTPSARPASRDVGCGLSQARTPRRRPLRPNRPPAVTAIPPTQPSASRPRRPISTAATFHSAASRCCQPTHIASISTSTASAASREPSERSTCVRPPSIHVPSHQGDHQHREAPSHRRCPHRCSSRASSSPRPPPRSPSRPPRASRSRASTSTRRALTRAREPASTRSGSSSRTAARPASR